MIEYTKYQWSYQNNYDVLQWAINAQNVIHYDNELKLFNVLRE